MYVCAFYVCLYCWYQSVNYYYVLSVSFMQHAIGEYDRVRGKISELYSHLMVPHLNKVDEVIGPGLTIITWTSVNIQGYVDAVYKAVAELELLVDRVAELKANRIDVALNEMLSVELLGLPPVGEDADPITIQEFLNNTKVCMHANPYIDLDPHPLNRPMA